MANYKPPIENLPIFDSSLFDNANTAIPDVSDTYLTFPVAQGAETLKDTTVDGDLLVLGETTVGTLNYTTLNPPVSTADVDLDQVLTNGNDAGGLTMVNVGKITTIETSGVTIESSGINCTNLDATDEITCQTIGADGATLGGLLMNGTLNINTQELQNLQNLTCGNYINIANGSALGDDTRATLALYNNNGNNGYFMEIGDQAGTLNEENTFKILDKNGQQYFRVVNSAINQITLSADKLLYKTDTTQPDSATGYILDSYKQPPSYRQIVSNINQNLTINNNITPTYLFGCNIYDGDTVFNYGINYAEILLSSFYINFTSDDPFLLPNNCQIYLGNSPTYAYDPAKGNRIVFSIANNAQDQPNFSFSSSIPIILYYQNGDIGSSFENLYLNIAIQDVQVYYISITNTNLVISSYITGKLTDPLAWNT